MRAEIAKLTYLPLPRWTAAATIGVAVVAGVLLFVFRPQSAGTYEAVPESVLQFGALIAAAVLGTWFATLDYASGTWQRTLTAESSRNRVLTSKLAVAVGAVTLLTLGVAVTIGGFAVAASDAAGVPIDQSDLLRGLLGQVPGVVGATAIGFGFGLLTRAFGGGITLSLAFLFVLSSVFVLVPSLVDWSYTALAGDLAERIAGEDTGGPNVAVEVVAALGWLTVIVAPAWVRFLHSDVK